MAMLLKCERKRLYQMTNLIDASRSYEANVTAFNASKNIASQGLNLGNS